MERGDRYAIWPAAFVDGVFSVPDPVLISLWREIVAAGKHRHLFYNGLVTDEVGWIEWIKNPGNYPLLVVDSIRSRIVAVAWLNHAVDGVAAAHFCMIGLPRPKIGQVALRYWSSVKILHVLVGFTPETNTGAVKYAESIGFIQSGYIPKMCNMVYEGLRVGAIVTTYQMRKEEA